MSKPRLFIRMQGAEELAAAFLRTSAKCQMAAIRVVAETALGIQADAKKNAPVDTGRLRSSIQTTAYNGGLSYEVKVNAEYGAEVEFGRRPGSFPPVDAVEAWAKRKGMEGLGYVIARKLYRQGRRAKPYFVPAVDRWQPSFQVRLFGALRKEFP